MPSTFHWTVCTGPFAGLLVAQRQVHIPRWRTVSSNVLYLNSRAAYKEQQEGGTPLALILVQVLMWLMIITFLRMQIIEYSVGGLNIIYLLQGLPSWRETMAALSRPRWEWPHLGRQDATGQRPLQPARFEVRTLTDAFDACCSIFNSVKKTLGVYKSCIVFAFFLRRLLCLFTVPEGIIESHSFHSTKYGS